jgi:hypothetical protein
MDEKNQEGKGFSADTTSTDTVNTETPVVNEVEAAPFAATEVMKEEVVNEVEGAHSAMAEEVTNTMAATEGASAPAAFNFKAYAAAVAGILVIVTGLLFVLEKEGRVSIGLFSGMISQMEANNPVAKVNDVVIPQNEFDSSLQQLIQMAGQQGADVTDQTVVAQFRTQAIETLVNAELLRQAALAEGMTASSEAIEARFTEITEGVGGPELLAERMAEFGVTEESLRRDIENEILIQGLFDAKVTTDTPEITDEQIAAFYEQAGGVAAGLPPLGEIAEQIEAQIKFEQEQTVIGEYVETLRSDAEVEILI